MSSPGSRRPPGVRAASRSKAARFSSGCPQYAPARDPHSHRQPGPFESAGATAPARTAAGIRSRAPARPAARASRRGRNSFHRRQRRIVRVRELRERLRVEHCRASGRTRAWARGGRRRTPSRRRPRNRGERRRACGSHGPTMASAMVNKSCPMRPAAGSRPTARVPQPVNPHDPLHARIGLPPRLAVRLSRRPRRGSRSIWPGARPRGGDISGRA